MIDLKVKLAISCLLVMGMMVNAQNSKEKTAGKRVDSLKTIDWLEYDYQYLDKDFQIVVPSDQFDQWNSKYRYKPDTKMTYADSLKVVLNEELENPSAVRQATLALGYTWDRASWSILLNGDEAKAIGEQMGYRYPYRFVSDLRDPSVKSKQKTFLLKSLKKRLQQLEIEGTDKKMAAREMMKLSFQYSPERLKVVDSILASQGSSRRKD